MFFPFLSFVCILFVSASHVQRIHFCASVILVITRLLLSACGKCRGTCYESGDNTSLWFVILDEAVSVGVLWLAVFWVESWQCVSAVWPSRIAISTREEGGGGVVVTEWSRLAYWPAATCHGRHAPHPRGVVCLFHTRLTAGGKVDSCGHGQDCQPAAGSGAPPPGTQSFCLSCSFDRVGLAAMSVHIYTQ